MSQHLTPEPSKKQPVIAQHLSVHGLPLAGKHLIEASAGTGKTYNITRIYLRMLLERKLSVEQILVMTFTKDATQELKGRIDATLRDTINRWPQLVKDDEFFKHLALTISFDEAKFLLQKALLLLDEAAIFTIHGFCQRVLTEHAFSTNLAFDSQLSTDLSDIVIQAIQDWYRSLAIEHQDDFMLLSEFWHSPDKFLQVFGKAIYQRNALDVLTKNEVHQHFKTLVEKALDSLQLNQSLIEQVLIASQKGNKADVRKEELSQLTNWLETALYDSPCNFTQMPTSFYHGTRYARSEHKAQLQLAFAPVKKVNELAKNLLKELSKADAYAIAKAGIYHIRALIMAQKAQNNVLGFDDLIHNFADALSNNHVLAKRIQRQFPVALVDEFQDTDPVQFGIFSQIYHMPENPSEQLSEDASAIFMIGDPKQAIYGFRGGDVFAYLSARNDSQYQWIMDTNWRSSAGVIQGYNRLFYGKALSQSANLQHSEDETPVNTDVFGYDIPYLPVKASPAAKAELAANDSYKAIQFIHFEHDDGAEKQKVPQAFRGQLASWCAQEIDRLLHRDNETELEAQDIAILVRDGTEAAAIKTALEAMNLASVYLSNRNNLFETEECKALLTLLKGVLYSDNEKLFSAAIASPLLGYGPTAFYQLQQDELAWQALKFKFDELKHHWLTKSFMSMALKLMHEHFCIESQEKDRMLTNVLHLFELLQITSQRHHQPHELLYWLEQHSLGQASASENELRLESDDNLIKIVTQHGSKGLEYPVVFVPFASRYKNPLKFGNQSVSLIEYHDEQGQLITSLDASDKAKKAMLAEQHAETIRLLYVAITRAEQRCYLLTTDFENAHLSPIGLTVKALQGELLAALNQLVDSSEHISLDVINQAWTLSSESAVKKTPRFDNNLVFAAKFTSKIERDWWLSSFSALTRSVHHTGMTTPDRDHELAEQGENHAHLIQFSLKKGAQTGNFLHDLFEYIDFASPHWQETVVKLLPRYQANLVGYTNDELITWLNQILTTPLAANSNGEFCLASLPWQQTLREAEFYFPMENANMTGLAKLLSEHRNFIHTSLDQISNNSSENQTSKVGFSSSPASVQLPLYRQLKGMMHGFIDLLFEHNGKYYVSDYKSSHLGDDYSDYQVHQLHRHMEANYYDLQYLIYALALHRYLSAQLPDYCFDRHFGGVYYLYLRGMKNHQGDNSNEPAMKTGVYYTSISKTTITALDALFSDSLPEDKVIKESKEQLSEEASDE